MKILLTNDDGYNAPGIKMLQKQLAKVGEVYIVAPEKGMSAKSVSLTINVPLHIIEREKDVYSVDGYPADCVALAIEFFKNEKGIEFDLVVSGCNNGLNHSYDSIYSGTIGACLEALTYRKKTIAISCKLNDFDTVEENLTLIQQINDIMKYSDLFYKFKLVLIAIGLFIAIIFVLYLKMK